jgi:hypothetical protein
MIAARTLLLLTAPLLQFVTLHAALAMLAARTLPWLTDASMDASTLGKVLLQLVALQATPAMVAARTLPWLMPRWVPTPLLQLVVLQATPAMIAARTPAWLTALLL